MAAIADGRMGNKTPKTKLATALRFALGLGGFGGAVETDRDVMKTGFSRWIPSERGSGAKDTARDSFVSGAVAAETDCGEDSAMGARATAAAVAAVLRLKFRAVLRPSGNLAPHLVQIWRVSEFAILHFEQNIGTSTLLKREYSRVVSDYAKDSVRLCATWAGLLIAKSAPRKRE